MRNLPFVVVECLAPKGTGKRVYHGRGKVAYRLNLGALHRSLHGSAGGRGQ
jgi:hypothetical protein